MSDEQKKLAGSGKPEVIRGETTMTNDPKQYPEQGKEKNDDKVEHVLNEIVPPGQDVTDDKLKDPGKAIKDDSSRVVNKS